MALRNWIQKLILLSHACTREISYPGHRGDGYSPSHPIQAASHPATCRELALIPGLCPSHCHYILPPFRQLHSFYFTCNCNLSISSIFFHCRFISCFSFSFLFFDFFFFGRWEWQLRLNDCNKEITYCFSFRKKNPRHNAGKLKPFSYLSLLRLTSCKREHCACSTVWRMIIASLFPAFFSPADHLSVPNFFDSSLCFIKIIFTFFCLKKTLNLQFHIFHSFYYFLLILSKPCFLYELVVIVVVS